MSNKKRKCSFSEKKNEVKQFKIVSKIEGLKSAPDQVLKFIILEQQKAIHRLKKKKKKMKIKKF